MQNMLQAHQLRVTIYRRHKEPLVFALSSNGIRPDFPHHADLMSCTINRTLQGPAQVVFSVPGKTAPNGQRWSDLVRLSDMVQIDMRVSRNPDKWSQGWRSLFFGPLVAPQHGFTASDDSYFNDGIFTATCMMGMLKTQQLNLWKPFNVVGGSADAIALLWQRLATRVPDGFISDAGFSAPTARAAQILFEGLLYRVLPISRRINGSDYTWEEMHGYRFEGDKYKVPVLFNTIGTKNKSWYDTILSALDAPAFYEFYMENLPVERIEEASVYSENPPPATKQPRLLLPGQTYDRAEVFIVRPIPFPVYDEPRYEGVDSRAWDRLPTYYAVNDLGPARLHIERTLDPVFTYYNSTLAFFAGLEDLSFQENANEQIILDPDKYLNMAGHKELDIASRRVSMWDSTSGSTSGSAKKEEIKAGIESAIDLIDRLNRQLFSWYQFGDRFYSGTVSLPGDLRLELGCRYIVDDLLFYVEGYSHQMTPNSFTTDIQVTRGLPTDVYGIAPGPNYNEYYDSLGLSTQPGRKRRDEEHRAIQGYTAINKFATARGL